MSSPHWQRWKVRCRGCGHEGRLSLWAAPKGRWGAVWEGFASHGAYRPDPTRSPAQCGACGGHVVDIEAEGGAP